MNGININMLNIMDTRTLLDSLDLLLNNIIPDLFILNNLKDALINANISYCILLTGIKLYREVLKKKDEFIGNYEEGRIRVLLKKYFKEKVNKEAITLKEGDNEQQTITLKEGENEEKINFKVINTLEDIKLEDVYKNNVGNIEDRYLGVLENLKKDDYYNKSYLLDNRINILDYNKTLKRYENLILKDKGFINKTKYSKKSNKKNNMNCSGSYCQKEMFIIDILLKNDFLVLITCFILSSKLNNDISYTNDCWRDVTDLNLIDINTCEKILLEMFNYDLLFKGDQEIKKECEKYFNLYKSNKNGTDYSSKRNNNNSNSLKFVRLGWLTNIKMKIKKIFCVK